MSQIVATSFDWWVDDVSYNVSDNNDLTSYNDYDSNISSSYENNILFTLWNWWRKNDTLYQHDEEISFSEDDNEVIIDQQQHNISQEQRNIKNRAVQFSHVDIREYDVTLGDHPKTKLYPISLDWTYNANTITLDLEEHINLNMQKQCDRLIEKPTKSGRSAFRLKAPERFQRITDVTGISMNALYKMEVSRHEELQLQRQQYIVVKNNNEGEKEDSSSDSDEISYF